MRPKHAHRAGLPSAVVYLLVHGELPPDGHPARGAGRGLLTAFQLKWSPTLLDEVRQLWAQHADEITAATPAGLAPWVARALAAPDTIGLEDGEEDDGGSSRLGS
jgi:hypothetical protein